MALDVETGTFDKVTTPTTTQSVSVGFAPKALMIWALSPKTANDDGVGDADGSFGFVDDADNNRSINWVEDDNLATSDSKKRMDSNEAIFFINSGASASITLEATSFDLTWTSVGSVATKIHWMAFGGTDITGVQVGSLVGSGSTGSQTITTDADCQSITAGLGALFILGNYAAVDSTSNNTMPVIGMATKTTERGLVSLGHDDGNANAEPSQMHKDDEIITDWDARDRSQDTQADFNGFNSSGFAVNWAIATTFTNFFLIIKGGKWQVGADTAKTSTTGTKATTTDFEPKGLFILNAGVTAAQAPTREDSCNNIGGSDDTTETSGGWSEEDTSDPTNVGIFSSITKCIRIMDPTDQSVIAEANVDSFNAAPNFTMNWTTVHASNAYRFLWLVCGDESAGATPVSKSTIFKHNVIFAISKTSILKHNIIGVVSKSSILKHNILSAVSKSSILKHQIIEAVSKSTIFKHQMAGSVSKSSILKHNIIGVVSKSSILKHNLLSAVSKSSILKHNIINAVSKSSILKHNVIAAVSKSTILKHQIIQAISKTTILKHNLIEAIGKSTIFKHDILSVVGPTSVSISTVFKHHINPTILDGTETITFTLGTNAISTIKGTDAIVLNRGTDAILIGG